MVPMIEVLAVAGVLGLAPAQAASAALPAALPTALVAAARVALCPPIDSGARVVGPGACAIDAARIGLPGGRNEPRGLVRFAAGLGASLAWDLADLPARRARLPEPIGGFRPGAAFRAHVAEHATGEGGAIGALITRWNTLYPPYGLARFGDVLNAH